MGACWAPVRMRAAWHQTLVQWACAQVAEDLKVTTVGELAAVSQATLQQVGSGEGMPLARARVLWPGLCGHVLSAGNISGMLPDSCSTLGWALAAAIWGEGWRLAVCSGARHRRWRGGAEPSGKFEPPAGVHGIPLERLSGCEFLGAVCLQVTERKLPKSLSCGKTFRGAQALRDMDSVAQWLLELGGCPRCRCLCRCGSASMMVEVAVSASRRSRLTMPVCPLLSQLASWRSGCLPTSGPTGAPPPTSPSP